MTNPKKMTRQDYCYSLFDFGLKNARASLFGALLLAMMILTDGMSSDWITRYDLLFLGAISIQAFLIIFRLEKLEETIAILCFHLVATIMEIHKTSEGIGSWTYPEACFFKIGNVPLFAGFMYSAVGSYIVSAWSVFDLKFENYPPKSATLILAIVIYLNFFTHHFLPDCRLLLFFISFFLFRKTIVQFTVFHKKWNLPLIISFLLIAFFIWIAENLSTYSNIWLYPHQSYTWKIVPFSKIGAWYLLMIISFVMVSELKKINYQRFALSLRFRFIK